MAERRVTTRLHVVPKDDVDKLFMLLKEHFPANSRRLQQLRGIAYCNTFLADRTILVEDAAAGGGATTQQS